MHEDARVFPSRGNVFAVQRFRHNGPQRMQARAQGVATMQPEGKTLTQGLIDLIRNKPVSAADLRQTALFALDAVAKINSNWSTVTRRLTSEW